MQACCSGGGGYRWYQPPWVVGGDAPNPLMINRPPPLATGLSYVQVCVCLMWGVESVLCAVFSLCYVQSLPENLRMPTQASKIKPPYT